MSSFDTRRILGSTNGRLSRSSCGFTLLLRFIDVIAEGVAGLGDNAATEGCKTRLDGFSPSGKVGNSGTIVSSNGDAFRAGLATLKLEGVEGGSVEVVGDAIDLFELIIHGLLYSIHFSDSILSYIDR
jgi:hypothetical protein